MRVLLIVVMLLSLSCSMAADNRYKCYTRTDNVTVCVDLLTGKETTNIKRNV